MYLEKGIRIITCTYTDSIKSFWSWLTAATGIRSEQKAWWWTGVTWMETYQPKCVQVVSEKLNIKPQPKVTPRKQALTATCNTHSQWERSQHQVNQTGFHSIKNDSFIIIINILLLPVPFPSGVGEVLLGQMVLFQLNEGNKNLILICNIFFLSFLSVNCKWL